MDDKAKKDPKRDRCYRQVKRRFKVWPSAYASGALVKCRRGLILKKEKPKSK